MGETKMEKTKSKVMLRKQAYCEWEKTVSFETRLFMKERGLVSFAASDLVKANKGLEKIAEKIGATDVFGVEYIVTIAGTGHGNSQTGTYEQIFIIYGDAYMYR